MKQDNQKINAYKTVKRGFYSRVRENERQERQKLIIIILVTFLVASILLFTASLIETSGGKYTFVYGEYKQRIGKDLAMSGKIRMIDLNALADYAGLEKSSSGNKMTYSVNGTEASFENGSNIATINGLKVTMPAKASVKNGYCLIPFSIADSMVIGVHFDADGKQLSATLKAGQNIYLVARNVAPDYPDDIGNAWSYINSDDEYIFTLVNKDNPIDESFPSDKDSLVEIPAKYRKEQVIYFYDTALVALQAMMDDMFALGYDDTYVTSAYRNHNYQTMLFEMYIENEMNNGYSYDEALARANKYSARPEHSEHRTGLCVDFTTKSIYGVVDDEFESTSVFPWLVENSWKYGFVLRYPEDKTEITGYQYESWHYRFVGLERASIMHQTGLCYEEYLEYFE